MATVEDMQLKESFTEALRNVIETRKAAEVLRKQVDKLKQNAIELEEKASVREEDALRIANRLGYKRTSLFAVTHDGDPYMVEVRVTSDRRGYVKIAELEVL